MSTRVPTNPVSPLGRPQPKVAVAQKEDKRGKRVTRASLPKVNIAPLSLVEISESPKVKYKADEYNTYTPEAYIDRTAEDLAAYGESSWVVVNLSGVKYVNDIFPGGHLTGNNYLTIVSNNIRLIAAEVIGVEPNEVLIVRDGPNFAIRVSGQHSRKIGKMIMQRILKECSQAIEVQCATANGEKKILEAEAIGKRLINVGQITFTSETTGREATYRGLRQEIYYLNRPETSQEAIRHSRNFTIDKGYSAFLDSFNLERRVENHAGIKRTISDAEILAEAKEDAEPVSGLRNFEQLKKDREAILDRGNSVRFAFFDGNAVGSFRSLGFLGELMMDTITSLLISYAAAKANLPERAIKLYRHCSGSEEFYFQADGKEVSQEKMEQACKDFMAELNSEAIIINAERQLLEETQMGRLYLKMHPKNQAEHVPVDITDCIRGRNKQYHRGITVTLGLGVIEPETDPHISPQRSSIEQHNKITEYGEKAKNLNSVRRQMLVVVDLKAETPSGKIIALKPQLANPKPIEEQAQDPLMDVQLPEQGQITYQVVKNSVEIKSS